MSEKTHRGDIRRCADQLHGCQRKKRGVTQAHEGLPYLTECTFFGQKLLASSQGNLELSEEQLVSMNTPGLAALKSDSVQSRLMLGMADTGDSFHPQPTRY